jgi:glycosyltransferase involved in cell wall biosynthesis
VLEAASHGLPAVLVAEEDNAAVELVEEGRNGAVCGSADPAEQAEAVLALAADPAIHERTRAWFDEHAATYSVAHHAERLRAIHAEVAR